MEILVERTAFKDSYTIGHLYVDGVFFCDTIEDRDRGLDDTMTLEQIKKLKVQDQTAIPTGRYRVIMNQESPKYKLKARNDSYYRQFPTMPRLDGVKGYTGILIHPGSTATDTSGCLLVGYNKVVGRLTDTRIVFKALYEKLMTAYKKNEPIWITYHRKEKR